FRRAGLFAERAEHAALHVDVVAIENFDFLLLAVGLDDVVMDIDVDDVDRAGDSAQLARDAAVVRELEHPAETIRRLEPSFRITNRHLRLEELTNRDLQPLEQVVDEKLFAPARLRIL